MIVTNVWIEGYCNSCGSCEEICPEVFRMDDIAVVKYDVDSKTYSVKIKEAAKICPVEVIKFE